MSSTAQVTMGMLLTDVDDPAAELQWLLRRPISSSCLTPTSSARDQVRLDPERHRGDGAGGRATVTLTVSDGQFSDKVTVDVIARESGNDTIVGGTGADIVFGGSGNDGSQRS
ncbi:hypothetical protein G3I17_35235 [Streptomyces sp. SID13031]|nr:hypothetical protein [Streptomyces sp. SID13031]